MVRLSGLRREGGLPVILGRAVASSLAVLQGVIDGVHDGGVLVSDVHSEILTINVWLQIFQNRREEKGNQASGCSVGCGLH